MKLKFGMDGHINVANKHTKFHQNPRGRPKFLVDFTWNDPIDTFMAVIHV